MPCGSNNLHMIDHRRKSIFVHIPKTAGTTISSALEIPKDHSHSTLEMIIDNWLGRNPLKRLFMRQVLGYYKFAFVRNPWDRMVSLFIEKQQTGWLNDGVEFSDFIRHLYSNPETISEDPNLRFHSQPCYHWLTIDDKLNIDFVGRFEQLQSDYEIICGKLGLPKSMLPVIRKRDRAPYSSFYNEETQQIVADRNRVDIEQFSYEFEHD